MNIIENINNTIAKLEHENEDALLRLNELKKVLIPECEGVISTYTERLNRVRQLLNEYNNVVRSGAEVGSEKERRILESVKTTEGHILNFENKKKQLQNKQQSYNAEVSLLNSKITRDTSRITELESKRHVYVTRQQEFDVEHDRAKSDRKRSKAEVRYAEEFRKASQKRGE